MAVYCYVRVSTDKQDNSAEAQTARLTEWAGRQGLEIARVYQDIDQSAHSIQLKHRTEGRLLWDAIQPGDTIVFTKVDRAFRNLADAAPAMKVWHDMGVRVRILDLDFDLSTPSGKLFFSQLVAFAQFESELHGQRKREVYAHKRKTGQPYSCTRPWGWRSVKGKDGKLSHWEPCNEEQELGQRLLKMRDAGWPISQIALKLCREGVRKPRSGRQGHNYYQIGDVRYLLRAAKAGYPKLPRWFWRANDYEQKLAAEICHGSPQSA